MQLSTREQLLQHVHALGCLERLHQGDDEGVVVLREQVALSPHLLGNLSTHLVHTLQGVPHASLLVLYEPHHTCGSSADDLGGLEHLEGHVSVLQIDAVDQLLLHLVAHDRQEGLLVHAVELRIRAGDGDRGAARLVEKQRALAEVVVPGHRALLLAVDSDSHLATGDDEERGGHLSLLNDDRAFGELLHLEGLHQPGNLLVREMSEDVDLSSKPHAPRVVRGLLLIPSVAQAQPAHDHRQPLLREDAEPHASAAQCGEAPEGLPLIQRLHGVRGPPVERPHGLVRDDHTAVLETLAPLQAHRLGASEAGELSVYDDGKLEILLHLTARWEIADLHVLDDLKLLSRGKLGEPG
mmetsp:Transcript_16930/g.53014  ORF Transcript_16930/g.53014 Transcript_16930/m.53014 type:complete len:353 (+) Transcript_16930:750-1808(+)